jgi:hypothetical protein
MRELESREKKMNLVQASGDKLLRDGHPAKKTVEVGPARGERRGLWLGSRRKELNRPQHLTRAFKVHRIIYIYIFFL